uniref:Spindle and kinetochore-associated protein 2 n=1 Tax=Capra hircus TaxID=9925 RepID=A0A8C2PF51_CAPHI
MASKLERDLESPETPGGGGWTRVELPPPAPKGVAAAWSLFNRRGCYH